MMKKELDKKSLMKRENNMLRLVTSKERENKKIDDKNV